MVRQNGDPKSAYWVRCRPDDPNLPDFKSFYADPLTVFGDTVPPMYEQQIPGAARGLRSPQLLDTNIPRGYR